MRRPYEPRNYYERIRTFLRPHHATGGQRMRISRADVQAFLKSCWVLGVWHRGRVAYWWLFWTTLFRRPRQFRVAIELAIIGHLFRRVAARLQRGVRPWVSPA